MTITARQDRRKNKVVTNVMRVTLYPVMRKFALFVCVAQLFGATPQDVAKSFYEVIRNGDSAGLAALLKDPSWKTVIDASGNTPLMYAAEAGTVASLKALLDAGADVDARNGFEITPLLLCATQEAKVRLLIAKGANVNARAKTGQNALLLAAGTPGTIAIVKLLLASGADPNKSDANPTSTPLIAAATANDAETFRLLLERGASVEGPAGLFSMSIAAAHGNVDMVQLLLARAVPADVPGPPVMSRPVKHGDMGIGSLAPLHFAASTGSLATVKLLLDHKADPNRRDVRGMTPLMLAIGTDHQDPAVVRLLLDRGADPAIQSKDGETALDWARKFNQPDVMKALHISAIQPAQVQSAKTSELREAVRKSSALMERVSGAFFAEGGCASCHSHNITGMALQKARMAGVHFPNSDAESARSVQNTVSWPAQQQRLMLRFDPPGGPSMTGYTLMQFAVDSVKPNATTDTMAHNTAVQQQLNGSWRVDGIVRPPMQDGEFTETAIAIWSLDHYGPPGRNEEYRARIGRGVSWLSHAMPVTAEDRNMQLLGSLWGGADRSATDRYARDLIATQRQDGGWSQTAYLASDAYATG